LIICLFSNFNGGNLLSELEVCCGATIMLSEIVTSLCTLFPLAGDDLSANLGAFFLLALLFLW